MNSFGKSQLTTALIALCFLTVRLAGAAPTGAKPPTETDPRLHPNGKGWRVERADIVDPSLPRVLMIGDSILNGYLPVVTKGLAGKANVDAWVNPYWQSEATNKLLAEVLKNGPYDVVHFNIGLHGWCPGRIPAGQYEPLTKAYVDTIKRECPKAKLIWATITPLMLKGKPSKLDPSINSTILEHNRMAAKVMKEEGVQISDFYALLVNKLNLAAGDQAHWTAPAYKILGDTATESILHALPSNTRP